MSRKLFTSNKRYGIRALSLFCFCVILMTLDRQTTTLEGLHQLLNRMLTPVVWSIDWPQSIYQHFSTAFKRQEALLLENLALKAELKMLKDQQNQLGRTEAENQQLRALLNSTKAKEHPFLTAEILSIRRTHHARQELMINRGENSHVYAGQAVLDAYGVFGQVVEVAPNLAKIRLLTDASIAIPSMLKRNGLRAIIQGDGNALRMLYLPKTSDIQLGDVVLTSGLGLQFPPGYPIGKVVNIDASPTDRFLHVTLAPAAKLLKSRYLLLPEPTKKVLT